MLDVGSEGIDEGPKAGRGRDKGFGRKLIFLFLARDPNRVEPNRGCSLTDGSSELGAGGSVVVVVVVVEGVVVVENVVGVDGIVKIVDPIVGGKSSGTSDSGPGLGPNALSTGGRGGGKSLGTKVLGGN